MKLIKWLIKSDISKKEFAERIGISESLVYHYLSGKRYPSSSTARKIMEATNGAVTPNDFIGEQGVEKEKNKPKEEEISLEEKIKKIRDMGEKYLKDHNVIQVK